MNANDFKEMSCLIIIDIIFGYEVCVSISTFRWIHMSCPSSITIMILNHLEDGKKFINLRIKNWRDLLNSKP